MRTVVFFVIYYSHSIYLDSGEIPHLHVGYTKLEPRLLLPRPVRRSKFQGNLHLYLFILRVTHICQATCTGHKIEG